MESQASIPNPHDNLQPPKTLISYVDYNDLTSVGLNATSIALTLINPHQLSFLKSWVYWGAVCALAGLTTAHAIQTANDNLAKEFAQDYYDTANFDSLRRHHPNAPRAVVPAWVAGALASTITLVARRPLLSLDRKVTHGLSHLGLSKPRRVMAGMAAMATATDLVRSLASKRARAQARTQQED
ncbi:hypothetical protein [Auritidibacter ignavus]|uniref:hypothetical protein n=1 Tax=Auritidibacter ignavus TaxID=678932 RepID=UPI00109C4366|nr:hypothetical protein [Auritidibacter ignavus]